MNSGDGAEGSETPLLPGGANSAHSSRYEASQFSVIEGDDDVTGNGAPRACVDVPYWTRNLTEALIEEYGKELIDKVNNKNGTPLICDAIGQKQYESARLLLELAQTHEKFVELGTGRCETLEWAINNRAEVVAKFVLDIVADEKLPVEDACCILTNYLLPLITEFPDLMRGYIKNDKFSFEYGRFSVSSSLIDKNGKRPIAMTTDQSLDRFRGYNAELAREFWMENCDEHSKDLEESTDFQVEMAAKFFCVDLHAVRVHRYEKTVGIRGKPNSFYFWNYLLYRIPAVPLDIFQSETLTAMANWMFSSMRIRFLLLLGLDSFTAVLFSLFAWLYGMKECKIPGTSSESDEAPSANDGSVDIGSPDARQVISLIAIVASCAVPSFSLSIRFSRIKIPSILIKLVILGHVAGLYSLSGDHNDRCDDDVVGDSRHDDLSAFLTSVECVFVWFLVVEALLAFDKIGQFVSMVKDSFKAALPFTTLGFFVLVGFSFAVRVVHNYTEHKRLVNHDRESEDEETSNATMDSTVDQISDHHELVCRKDDLTIPHVFKILFHACVGNFEEEMFRSRKDDGFIGVWRSFLFSTFLFIGGIVLISLLVAILSESFDKIKHCEKEMLVKCRAEFVSAAFFFVTRKVDKSEKRWWMLKPNDAFHRLFFLKPRHRLNYFHYLVPVDVVGKEEDSGWDGRIKEFEKAFKREIRDIRLALGQPSSRPEEEGEPVKPLTNKVTNIQMQVDKLSRGMEEIKLKLEEFLQQRPSDSD